MRGVEKDPWTLPPRSSRECQGTQPLCKTVWRSLKKSKIELPSDPAILLLATDPQELKDLGDIGTSLFIRALFTISKRQKHPKCLQGGAWATKMGCMDAALSEVSRSQKYKHCVVPLP